jgi:LacI family transcriptional regulator
VPPQPARPTLSEVAKAAGVSVPTASKVLNGRADVSAATRARVQSAIEALGYTPTTGRRTPQARAQVTIVFDALVVLYPAQVLSGILSAAGDLGVDIVVTDLASTGGKALGRAWFREQAAAGRCGVIVVTTEVTSAQVADCADAGLSLVAIDPITLDDASTDAANTEGLVSVSATNWSGGLAATEHLLAIGHRRIGFAGGPRGSRSAQQRLFGHLAALEKHRVEPDRELLLTRGFTYEHGDEMARTLLSLPTPPTAIVASSDSCALGVMHAARELGLALPDELSIVGFDDTYAAEWASPQLTTVRQPMREMGRLALRTVLSMARGERPGTHLFELATTLVVRASTTAPPAGGAGGTAGRRPSR